MKELMIKFFEDQNNGLSSKRLAGLSGWCLFLLLGFIGGIYMLLKGKYSFFLDLFDTIGYVSCIPLGISTFEFFSKRKQK